MNNILYVDFNGEYSLLDYARSHSELLLRKRMNNNGEYSNVDIVFKSVRCIFIPMVIEGIEISVINEATEVEILKKLYHFNTDYGYRIYCIKSSKEEKFYLNGGVVGVFLNQLDILETSLGDFMWSQSNQLIYWSND